jgi:hypothetical protein
MAQLLNLMHKKISSFAFLLFWFVRGTFTTQPMRWIVVTATISLGLSLAVAINVVNRSAIKEFNHSTNILRGDASYQLKAKTRFFNELIFENFLELKKKFISPNLDNLLFPSKPVNVISEILFFLQYLPATT